MPICCCLGEAAGTAVAIAHNTDKNVHTVDIKALQKKLIENGDMFESMGIKVFSNLGDYPEWWQQICDMGVTGFKTNFPDAYTEWWLSTH